jgi:hypothetical protein
VAAAEGARFIAAHIIRVTDRAFDDLAAAGAERDVVRHILGWRELRFQSRKAKRALGGEARIRRR